MAFHFELRLRFSVCMAMKIISLKHVTSPSATVSLRISSAIAAAKRCLYVIGDKVTVASSNVGSSSRVFVIMGFPDAMQVL